MRIAWIIAAAIIALAAGAGIARADPISVAIVSAAGIGAGSALFTVATAAVTAALTIGASIGLSALSGLLFKPPKQPGGIQAELDTGSDVPRSIPFGRVGLKGHLVYWNTHVNENDHLQLVFVLADWECDGIEAVWVNGELFDLTPLSVTGTEHARYQVNGYDGRITVRWFAGTADQLADTQLVSGANPPPRWTANDRLRGLCYVSLTLKHNPEVFAAGIPDFLWVIRGAKLYDLRKDTTAGGSGPHRWGDPTTWEWSENPAIAEYNYRRGFYREGPGAVPQLVLGMGVPGADLLADMYVATANVCDETIVEDSQNRPLYACSIIASADVEHRVAIEAFTSAMAGYSYERAGAFGVVPGAAQVPVAALTMGDLAVGYAFRWAAKRSRAELINGAYGTYADPDNQWQASSYPAVENSAWEAEDTERLARQIDLPSISWPFQAGRVAEIRVRELREQATATITVGLKWIHVDPGEWVTFTYRDTRTYRVVSKRENEDRTITFELAQISASVYGEDAPVVIFPDTPAPQQTLISTVSGLAAAAVLVSAGSGQQVPAIRVNWTPITLDPQVKAVIFEYRVVGSTVASRYRYDSPADGEAYLFQGIAAQTDYEVRATIETEPVRVTTWTDWVSTVTGGAVPSTVGLNFQVFDTPGSHTWIKPPTAPSNALVIVECWGGGGAGGTVGNAGSGGSGGSYARREFRAGELPASVAVDVGAGGIAGGGAQAQNTTFGAFITAFRGGNGANSGSGTWGGPGGGGMLGIGIGGGTGAGGAGGPPEGFGGGAGGDPVNGDARHGHPGGFGGGGAGGFGTSAAGNGGNSCFGGAGGGARPGGVGGTSVYGGNGGDANQPGQAPGGGGGGAADGARGECRVWVVG